MGSHSLVVVLIYPAYCAPEIIVGYDTINQIRLLELHLVCGWYQGYNLSRVLIKQLL